ncbi:MAG: hypothetical protein K0U24_07330 [Gammaproteobacteria bacterium]|nr:hypothetical protein [Gammaproteobacteria bacterium]
MDDNFESKLHVYIRSERALFDIFLRDKARQLFCIAIGFIALLTALVMLNISFFYALNTIFPVTITAFILAGINVFLFLISLLFSKRKRHKKEVEALKDIRDFAEEALKKDLKVVKNEAVEIGQSVGHVVRDVSSIVRGEAFGLANLLPIIRHILKNK